MHQAANRLRRCNGTNTRNHHQKKIHLCCRYKPTSYILGDSIDYVEGRLMFDAMTNRNHNADLPILAITQE